MPYRIRTIALTLCTVLAMLTAPLLSSAQAGPGTPVSLTKDVTVGAPPSGTFAGASTGDGWDVLFYRDRVFNVFHHGSQFIVDCHLQTDGTHCDTVGGISPWPKTVSSPDPVSDFTTPSHASGWIDQTTGDLYGWTSRSSDGTGGVVCVDLTSSAENPYCGFTALTAIGANTLPYTTEFGGRAIVGTEMLTYDVPTQQMLCFSTATHNACADQPYDVSIGGITPAATPYTDHSTLAAGGKVFVHVPDDQGTGGVLTCFDPQTDATCTGTWPQLVSDSYPGINGSNLTGTAFPFLSANGTATGVCLPYDTVDPCWDLTGASIVTPPALISALGHTDIWNDGTVFGTRVFVPTGEADGGADAVYCYDFATGAGCPNFPIETASSTYLYTVTADPVRTGCMWINANDSGGGGSQIRNFDAFDGSSGCTDRVHVTDSIVIPDAGCAALGWTSVQVLDPSRAVYTDATLSLTDAQGNVVPGGGNLTVDGQGTFDLTGLTIPDSVLYTVTFTNPTFSTTGVVFRFTWDSQNTDTCVANATRVPDAPTITSVTPNALDGGLTVALTPPGDPGTSPITSYLYSTDNGATWRDRADGGTTGTSLEITQASSDGTALLDGVTYDVMVRAVNDVGTGLASNSISAVASVPELLSAPASAVATLGTATALSPVSIAGFTADVEIDASTTSGTIAVVGNAGLDVSPCTTCSGATITFSGPQDAVNVALATLSETAANLDGGTVAIAVTKVGDLTPSQSASIVFTVVLPQLSTPTAPTVDATSPTTVDVSFDPIANAVSYTVRVYLADGTTPVGTPITNFTSGDQIAGLDPNTSYRFSVTAIGDATNYSDSPEGALGSGTTLPSPTTTTAAPTTTLPPTTTTRPPTTTTLPPPAPCLSRPTQLLPSGGGTVYSVRDNGRLATAPAFNGNRAALKPPIIGAVATASGLGSWSFTGTGGIFTAGDAQGFGSLARQAPRVPVTDIAGTGCSTGYNVLAADGRVFAFGHAHYYGGMTAAGLNRPAVGLAVTCSGGGYYMVSNAGAVFTFGNARFHGALANARLTSPIIAIVPNCTDGGYWLVARDGHVFSFGSVQGYGGLGGRVLAFPIVALLPTPTFQGYWLVAANGKTFPFGDARI